MALIGARRALIKSGLDPATSAWVAAVIVAGGTVSATQIARVNNLITTLRSSGVLSKLDRLWLYASENAQQASIDLIGDHATTINGTPTFTANAGYVGTAGGSNINSNFNASLGGVNYTQNAAHVMLWNNATVAGDGNCQVSLSANPISHIYADLSGSAFFRIQDSGAAGQAVANGHGFYIGNRSGASAWQGYKNGSSIGSGTDASSALVSDTWTTPAATASGQTPSADQISAVGFGGNLSSTDVTNYYNAMRTYMTAVGVP